MRSMPVRGTATIACAVVLAGCGLIDRVDDRPDGVPAGRAASWTVKLTGRDGVPLLARPAGDAVLLVTSEALIALDRRTGRQRWRTVVHSPFDDEIQADDDVVVAGDSVVVMAHDRPLEAPAAATVFDLATGAFRFSTGGAGRYGSTTSVGVSGDLLVQSHCTFADGACQLSARHLGTGQERWQRRQPGNRAILPATFAGSLRHAGDGLVRGSLQSRGDLVGASAAAADFVMVISPRLDGAGAMVLRVTAVSVATGEVAAEWTGGERLTGTPYGRLLLQVGCQQLAALDAVTGRPVWSMGTACGSAFRPEGPTLNMFGVTPALVDGSLLAMTKDGAWVIDPVTGAVRWRGGTDVALLGLHAGTVVLATPTLDIVGVDLAGGAQKWQVTTPKGGADNIPYALQRFAVAAGLLVYDGREFIRKGSPHVLRAVDAATGQERWFARDRTLVGLGDGWVLTAKLDRNNQMVKPAELGMMG